MIKRIKVSTIIKDLIYFKKSCLKDIEKKYEIIVEINENIRKKYNFSENYINLEYIITKYNVVYSEKSNLYDLNIKDLEEIIKNNYLIMRYQKLKNRELEILKQLNYLNYKVIPMNNFCYIEKNSNKSNIKLYINRINIETESIKTN